MQLARRLFHSICSFGPKTGLARVQPTDQIYVAMSGGVDSSTVAAMLAKSLGRDRVRGVFMNNWSSQSKCQEASWNSVLQICKFLKIDCHRIDLERDYWADVFEPMLEAYQRGMTPNPDVGCNHHIKFGSLVGHLRTRDSQFKWLATGHYAGIVPHSSDQMSLVARAFHRKKDQSYYLATVDPHILNSVVFPLAHTEKPDVRAMASALGLVDVASKPDSQGLCFVEQQQEVGQRGFRKFLAEYLVDTPGPILLANDPSRVVGQHAGLWTHTIGQRASVAMPQSSPDSRGQWYVVSKDIKRNALFIDRGTNSPLLFVDRVISGDFKWHAKPSGTADLYAQYRSLQEPWKIKHWRATDNSSYEFDFDTTRRAVAPGQYLVVYENDAVIGAGTIEGTANIISATNKQPSQVPKEQTRQEAVI